MRAVGANTSGTDMVFRRRGQRLLRRSLRPMTKIQPARKILREPGPRTGTLITDAKMTEQRRRHFCTRTQFPRSQMDLLIVPIRFQLFDNLGDKVSAPI